MGYGLSHHLARVTLVTQEPSDHRPIALRWISPTRLAGHLQFCGWIRQETMCDRSSVTFDLRQCAGISNCRLSAGAEYYESQYQRRALHAAKRRASQLGYQLVPISDAQHHDPGVPPNPLAAVA